MSNNNNNNNKNTTNNRNLVLEVDHSKAGMQGADKAKVQRIVNEMSKNSEFYKNEQRKQDNRDKRIAKLLRLSAEFDQLPPPKLAALKQSVDSELENEILSCAHVARYAHCDMDAFYAAIEERDNPSLKTKPMAIGGIGMISTANYEARKFGIRAAMPGYIAQQLCKDLILIPVDFDKVSAATKQVREQAAKFDPDFISHGGDELCIKLDRGTFERAAELLNERDRTNNRVEQHTCRSISEADVVSELRRRIVEATKLTASVGVGPTRTLAKIASNFDKPNGQTILACRTPEEVKQYAWDTLSVRQIPGIGKVSEMMLDKLGVKTCQSMYENRYRLRHCFLPKTFCFLLAASVGLSGAVKNSNSKKKHHGFFVKHPSLAKKLAAANDDADNGDAAATNNNTIINLSPEEERELIASQRSVTLDFSSSDASSDDDELHENPHKDTHKHSVGCERTFHLKSNTREIAMEKVNRVFSRAVERLLDVTPCRLYQITIKAKKTDYSISNSSSNVQVLVQKKKSANKGGKEKEEEDTHKNQNNNNGDDEDDDDEQQLPEVKQESGFEDWETEEENIVLEIRNMIEGSITKEDFDMLLERFTGLCESTGFISNPKSYRLLGCRFAFQPGVTELTAKNEPPPKRGVRGKSGNTNNNNNNNNASSSTLPERRQRTLDDFFSSSASSVNNKNNTTTSPRRPVKNNTLETTVVDLLDDDDDDDDDDQDCMMMMMPTKKKTTTQNQKKQFCEITSSDEEEVDGNSNDQQPLSRTSPQKPGVKESVLVLSNSTTDSSANGNEGESSDDVIILSQS